MQKNSSFKGRNIYSKHLRHSHRWQKAQTGQILTCRESMRDTVEEEKSRGIPHRSGTPLYPWGIGWTLMGAARADSALWPTCLCMLSFLGFPSLKSICLLSFIESMLTPLPPCWAAGSGPLSDSSALSYPNHYFTNCPAACWALGSPLLPILRCCRR